MVGLINKRIQELGRQIKDLNEGIKEQTSTIRQEFEYVGLGAEASLFWYFGRAAGRNAGRKRSEAGRIESTTENTGGIRGMTICDNGQNWEVYTSLPDGWRIDKGAQTAPRGYEMIYNGQPRWLKNDHLNKERETALLRTYPASEYNARGELLGGKENG